MRMFRYFWKIWKCSSFPIATHDVFLRARPDLLYFGDLQFRSFDGGIVLHTSDNLSISTLISAETLYSTDFTYHCMNDWLSISTPRSFLSAFEKFQSIYLEKLLFDELADASGGEIWLEHVFRHFLVRTARVPLPFEMTRRSCSNESCRRRGDVTNWNCTN